MLDKLESMKIWIFSSYWKTDKTYASKKKWESMSRLLDYTNTITMLMMKWSQKTNSLWPLHPTSLLMLTPANSVTHSIMSCYHKELSLNLVFIKLMPILLKKDKNLTIWYLINILELFKSSQVLLTSPNLTFTCHLIISLSLLNSRNKL